MMDYYSDFPCPNEKEIIKDITNSICKEYNINNTAALKKLCAKYLEEMGGVNMMGSYTGYYVYSRHKLYHDVASYIYCQGPPPSLKFKTIIEIIIFFQNLYKLVVHNRYCPGGEGYIEAECHFNSNIDYLPPIGNKPLYTPIYN